MKLKIDFGFEIEYRGNGEAILRHEQAAGISKIMDRATDLFGGHTRVYTFGEWKDPDTNQVVAEQGVTISVLASGDNNQVGLKIDQMVHHIKYSLQQKAVAVTRTEVQFDIL